MSGIKYLADIYEKKGKDFIEKLFSQELSVTENLDGSSFSFERDFTGDNISFYKKDQENPITKVDRILMRYYEKPINYIESLPESVKSEIPKGWRFGMIYFPNTKPVRIEYERLPKNHLILTHILVRDEFGETTRTIQDKIELDEWAEKLGIEKAPIIFQGRLNDDQKMSIMDFLSTPLMDLKTRFKTESFSKYLISLLNSEIIKTTLGKDLLGEIDSLVFRFEEYGKEDIVLAKMVDPVFYEISKDKKVTRSSYFPSDIYSLCLIDIMNFVLERDVESFNAEGTEPEERYINFVFSVFKSFIYEEGERYIGADFNKPEYLKSENFEINKELIVDKDVVEYLDEDEVYCDILQMILNSFRKFKRKPHGFFTEGLIEQFNLLVEEIADYINAKRKEKIEESLGLPTFVWFKKTGSRFKITEEESLEEEIDLDFIIENTVFDESALLSESLNDINEGKDESEGELKKSDDDASEFFSFKDFKKVVSTHKEKKKIKILNEKNQKVNLIIGKFQPFNNGHLKMCSRLKKENDLPVFLCVVHPGGETSSKKYPFTEDLIKKTIGSLTSENDKLFAGYKIVPTNLLEDVVKSVTEHVNPISVCIGEKDFENMVLQRDWVRSKYDLNGNDIEIFKTPYWANNEEIRSYIQNTDFQKFKNKVPKSIAVLFNEFVREMQESSNREDII
jgi:nicotinamide mononucleotide adenylyltransferase